MADIFLSYARTDRARIELLVEAIENAGYSVWWDQALTGGRDFSKDIEEQLNAAKVVLVAWSSESVKSHWVRDEAEAGRRQEKLVPLMLDSSQPPMGFRQTQTVDLSSDPFSDHSLEALAAALDAKIGGAHSSIGSESSRNRGRKLVFLAIPAVLLAMGGLTYFANPEYFGRLTAEPDENEARTLAIMPFSVLGDPELSFLGQGLSAKLANDLSAFPRLRIIAGTSTNAMAEQSLTAKDIGERFDIGTIVEGDIQASGNRLEVSVRLVDSATTQLLWSGEVEGDRSDLQALENTLLLDIASALQTRLGIVAAPPRNELQVDQAAYDAYLRGLDAINRRGFFDPEQAIKRDGYRALTRAVELQPDFADAWAARAYLGLLSSPLTMNIPRSERRARIGSDVEMALELEPGNRLALASRARLLSDENGKIEEAIRILEGILEEDPDYHPALYHMAIAHISGGDNQQALEWSERLVASDPFNVAQLGFQMIATWRQSDYPAFKRFLSECELCVGKTRFWAFALSGIASPQQIREDQAEVIAALREEMPPVFAQHYSATIEALGSGTMPPQETIEWLLTQNLPEYALAARFGATEEALKSAKRYVDQGLGASDLPLIMVDARISFPPEARTDSRYHALFDNEYGRNILAYRRRHGILSGLPLAPGELDAEKLRMAAMPFNAGGTQD